MPSRRRSHVILAPPGAAKYLGAGEKQDDDMAKEIDFPPVWLAGFAAIGGVIGRIAPIDLGVNSILGAGLILVGLVLMLVAAAQMMMARTTVIPHRDPNALVMGGVFSLSRNPIYLADALVLVGLYLHWDALVALPLVAVFMAVITRRFIRPEEARLQAIFGEIYADYCARTRRWL
jgi:protein-S-isoprenylcysteine O-methyltransferase Ste14